MKFITIKEYLKKIKTNRKPFTVIIWRKYKHDAGAKWEKFKKRSHFKNGLTRYKNICGVANRMERSCFCLCIVNIPKTIEGVKYWTQNTTDYKFKIQLLRKKK